MTCIITNHFFDNFVIRGAERSAKHHPNHMKHWIFLAKILSQTSSGMCISTFQTLRLITTPYEFYPSWRTNILFCYLVRRNLLQWKVNEFLSSLEILIVPQKKSKIGFASDVLILASRYRHTLVSHVYLFTILLTPVNNMIVFGEAAGITLKRRILLT